jgi:hypothetical protein
MKVISYFIIFFLFVLNINIVNGFGLASSYLENNTMFLSPGKTQEYKVELQNNDNSEIKVKFRLESEIAKVLDEKEYYIVGGENKVKVITLLIKVPENSNPGEEYTVKYSAVPISVSNNRAINLNIKFNKEFKVVVNPTLDNQPVKKRSYLGSYAGTIIIIALFIIAVLLIFRKNRLLSRKMFRKYKMGGYERKIKEIKGKLKKL